MADDEDEDIFQGLYDNGVWMWCDKENQLKMIYYETRVSSKNSLLKLVTGKFEFKNDLDILEQLRFRNRYQRKVKQGEPDVVTLQDVKNLVLYTAPVHIQTVQIINILHTATIERMLRALILYCEYYIQVKELIDESNTVELKLKTERTYEREKDYQNDLSDLRALVGHEYCSVIMGIGDVRRYHHKGPTKEASSLGHKDVMFFETLIRFIVQIIWISLGRVHYNLLEVEISRILKSDHYNVVEHVKKTKILTSMSKSDREILVGENLRVHTQTKRLLTRSPLVIDTVYSQGKDFRNMGLATINHKRLPARLDYFKKAICLPEEDLLEQEITLGILGLQRTKFDSMLKLIPKTDQSKGALSTSKSRAFTHASKKSQQSKMSKDDKTTVKEKLIPTVYLPPRESDEYFIIPTDFPNSSEVQPSRFNYFRQKWQNRRIKLMENPRDKKLAPNLPKWRL